MLTYNDVYNFARQEKYNPTLQKLPKNFFDELKNYLNEKRKLFEKEEISDTIKKLKKQFENIDSLINELFEIRLKKIINLAFLAKISGITKSDIENMLQEEKDFFNKVLDSMKQFDEKIKTELSNVGEKKDLKNKNTQMIKFIEDVSEFLDGEGITCGPFKKGDIVNISKEIAEILVMDKKAIKVE